MASGRGSEKDGMRSMGTIQIEPGDRGIRRQTGEQRISRNTKETKESIDVRD